MVDRSDSSTGTELTPFERAVDTALFWPFDLGVLAAERLPEVAGRVRDQLVFARFIGRLAVQQGNVEIRRRLHPEPRDEAAAPVADPLDEPSLVGSPATAGAEITADQLALPDYDQLPAAHIVEKLEGLDADERSLIGDYEAAHRARRTVLGQIDRLRER